MSRKACRKQCDGQNARLPLPNDLKLGGLNGLVRKLSENDRNYFLRSSRQNETMFVSDIGMAFHDFLSFKIWKKSWKRHT